MKATRIKIIWSNKVKILTILASLLFIIIEYTLINNFIIHYNLLSLSIFLFILFTITSFIVRVPLHIILYENGILLKRIVGKVIFPYNEIVFIERFTSIANVKLYGSGGFMGYLGVYSNRDFGIYQSYVENPQDAFIIITRNKRKTVLSCPNSTLIINTIKQKI